MLAVPVNPVDQKGCAGQDSRCPSRMAKLAHEKQIERNGFGTGATDCGFDSESDQIDGRDFCGQSAGFAKEESGRVAGKLERQKGMPVELKMDFNVFRKSRMARPRISDQHHSGGSAKGRPILRG